MKPIHLLSLCTLASAVAVSSVQAQGTSFSSKPLGYTTVDCLSGSDTIVSVCFHQKSTFVGKLDAAPTVDPGNEATLTVNGTSPGWTANEFVNTHYVRMTSGTREGHWYHVMANEANTLTIDLNGDDFAGVVAADTFKLVEHWTLASVFPPGNPVIYESAGNFLFQRRTEVFFPDLVTDGVNLAADQIFYQVTGGEWREDATGNPVSNDVIIMPDRFMTIRHNAADDTTKFIPLGSVETGALVTPISSSAAGSRDNAIAIARPIPVAVQDYGLTAPAFTPSAGSFLFQRKDELFVFDNTVAALNKTAAHILYFDSNAGFWKDDLNGGANANALLIQPATGVIHRRDNDPSNGMTEFWKNNPTYTP